MLIQPDFEVQNEGSIYLLRPLTDNASNWIANHIPDDAQTWGQSIIIEHRYIADIVNGIIDDGLEVI